MKLSKLMTRAKERLPSRSLELHANTFYKNRTIDAKNVYADLQWLSSKSSKWHIHFCL